ncbi:type I secretion C-terminal target domain-containing protein [Aeromonas veronii]
MITGAKGGEFEQLNLDPNQAVSQVIDNPTPTHLTLSTSTPSVAEGQLLSLTATLDQVPQTAVDVTLTNGMTLTIPAGERSVSIDVLSAGEDVYLDAGQQHFAIRDAQGGNFEQLVVDRSPLTIDVTDTLDPTSVTLTADKSTLTEAGGEIIYTATLAHESHGVTTVHTQLGDITIADGDRSGTLTHTVPVGEDVYRDPSTVSNAITGAEGGNFERLVPNTAPVTTTITDTIDTTTISLTAPSTVVEGSTITYTAQVDHPVTGSDLVLTLSNGQQLTIPVGASSGTLDVATRPADVLAQGDSQVALSITSTQGGNYERLDSSAHVSTTVTDSALPVHVTLTGSPDVKEGGVVTWTAQVDHAPVTPLLLTLDNGSEITIKAGELTGSVDVKVHPDTVYVDAGVVNAAITASSGGGYSHLELPSGPSAVSVGDTIDTTTISLTAPSTVVEGSTITYTAQVDHPVTGSDLVLTLSNGQQLTIPVGASSGTLDVATRPADVLAQGDSQVALSITSTQGGNYERLDSSAHVSTTVTDSALPVHVTLTGSPDVKEGGVVTWTAQVDHAPVTPLLLTLDNGSEITIKAGELTGSVDVKVHPDTVYVDAGVVNAAITASSGGGYSHLELPSGPSAVSVGDTIDTTTISLTAPSTVVEGSTITYTAQVDHPVTGSDLVLTLSNGQQLTIPVGASSGTLDVATRPADVLAQGDSQVALSITSTQGGNYERLDSSAHVSTTVTDSALPVHVTLTGSPDVKEGGVVTWTAQVDHAPVTPLLLTLDNGSEITIKAGELTGSVDVKVHPDTVYVDAGVVNAAITASSGGGYSHLELPSGPSAVSVGDTIDTTTISLTAPSTVVEGSTITYTAQVDHPVTGSDLVLTLSNGQQLTIPVGASSGTLDVATRPADVLAQGDSQVALSITSTQGGNYERLDSSAHVSTTVTDSALPVHVTLTGSPDVKEGGVVTWTAQVDHAPVTPLLLTLDNGSEITIKAGELTGSVDVKVHPDTVYVDAGVVNAAITASSGGGYSHLELPSGPSAVSVGDTIDTTTISLTAPSTVVEGSTITHTAQVDHPVTGSDLVLTLSNGQQLTIPVGASSGTLDVATRPADVLAQGDSQVALSITSTQGGNYERLDSSAHVSTTVTDSALPVHVTLTGSPDVKEGGVVTWTAQVDHAPVTPLLLTLDNGSEITIKAGELTGSVDVKVHPDTVYVDAGVVNAAITASSGGGYSHLELPSGPSAVSVGDTIDTTSVTLTGTSGVKEGGDITWTVTLGAAAHGEVTVQLDNGKTVVIADGHTSGQVITTAPDDLFSGGSHVTASVVSATGGNFEQLAIGATATVSVVDNISPVYARLVNVTGSVTEGETLQHRVELTDGNGHLVQVPTGGSVTVTLTYGSQTTSPSDFSAALVTTVTIPAGHNSAVIENQTVVDSLYEGHEGYTLTISGVTDTAHSFESLEIVSGAGATVTAVINDADTAPVLSVANAEVTEGGDLLFTVTRSGDAQAAQSVKFATSDGTANSSDYTAASGTLTFNPGELSKSVTVHTTADTLFEGNENMYLTLSQPNVGSVVQGKAMGTIIDDDSAPKVASISSPSVTEGQSLVFDVALTNAASSLQKLAFSLGGGSAGVEDYGKPVFSNGVVLDHGYLAVPAGVTHFSVTLPTTDDLLAEPTETVPLTIGGVTGTGSILDNDAAPTHELPTSLALKEDNPSAVSGIKVADRDSAHLSTTLSVLHGTLLVTAGHATVQGNHGPSLTISGTAAEINAALATLTYTGKPDYHGADTLQIETSDGHHHATGAVPITVASVADIVADSLHVNEDASLSFNPLTGQGGASADNFEDNTRQVTGHTNPSHGTLTLGKDGAAHYTPVANYHGADSFTYTVSAGGSTETATVTIDVASVNDAPTAPDVVLVSGSEDTHLPLSWGDFHITDVDGGKALGIKIGSLPADGKLLFTDDGRAWKAVTVGQVITKAMMDAGHFHFVPDANEAGDDAYHHPGVGNMKDDYAHFDFTPTDGEPVNGQGALSHMHIDIAPKVDTPVLTVSRGTMTHQPGRTTIEVHQQAGQKDITVTDGHFNADPHVKIWHLSDIQGQGGNVHGAHDKSDIFMLTDDQGAILPAMAGAVHGLDGGGDKIDSPQDYIFLAGPRSRYEITYSADHPNTAGGGMDNLSITDKTTGQKVSVANNIESIIFGDGHGLVSTQGMMTESGAKATTHSEPGVDHYPLQLTAALTDKDGSEKISDITFNGLPDGSTLNLGHAGARGSWVITHQELAQGQLVLTVKEGQSIDGIKVAVTSTEVDGEHATSTLTLARGAHVSVSHDAGHEAPVESVALQAAHHADAAPAPDHPSQLGEPLSGQHGQELFADDAINLKELPVGDHNLILSAGASLGFPLETMHIDNQSGHDLLGSDQGSWLFGITGNDRILGGLGDDVIRGGMGNDSLTGGAGHDLFVWGHGDEGTVAQPAIDTITDFHPEQGDKIDLAHMLQGVTGNHVDSLLNNLSASVSMGSNGLNDVNLSVSPAGDGHVTQQITLKDVDLTSWNLTSTSSHDILQSMVEDQHSLIIQHP